MGGIGILTRWTSLRVLAVLALLGPAPVSPAVAQEKKAAASPSLEDTFAWLTKTLNTAENGPGPTEFRDAEGQIQSYHAEVVEARFESGTLHLETRTTWTNIRMSNRLIIRLADLNPTAVTINSSRTHDPSKGETLVSGVPTVHWVSLSTTNRAKAVRSSQTIEFFRSGTTDQSDGQLDNAGFPFKDRALAERVQRAFAHAIRLSGGKPSAKDVF